MNSSTRLTTRNRAQLVAAVLAISSTAVMADGKKDCTTEPRASWKQQMEAEAAARAAGYEVRRSKVEGACYEVYAVKDGKKFELFFNPVDLKLMQIVTK